jgi:hypothetical protein
MPGETAVTIPVSEPTVAIEVLLLLQVPPGVILLKFAVVPTQADKGPVIRAGSGFTVITAVAMQPEESIYVITVVPAETPVTTPVEGPTVATAVFELLHTPVPGAVKVIVDPTQTLPGPEIGPAPMLTVTVTETEQPEGSV